MAYLQPVNKVFDCLSKEMQKVRSNRSGLLVQKKKKNQRDVFFFSLNANVHFLRNKQDCLMKSFLRKSHFIANQNFQIFLIFQHLLIFIIMEMLCKDLLFSLAEWANAKYDGNCDPASPKEKNDVPEKEKKRYDWGFEKFAYDIIVSDKIGPSRVLPKQHHELLVVIHSLIIHGINTVFLE